MHDRKDDLKSAYILLGISEDAKDAEVKSAYRKKAFETHPDKSPAEKREEAAIKFREVDEAFKKILQHRENQKETKRHEQMENKENSFSENIKSAAKREHHQKLVNKVEEQKQSDDPDPQKYRSTQKSLFIVLVQSQDAPISLDKIVASVKRNHEMIETLTQSGMWTKPEKAELSFGLFATYAEANTHCIETLHTKRGGLMCYMMAKAVIDKKIQPHQLTINDIVWCRKLGNDPVFNPGFDKTKEEKMKTSFLSLLTRR